MAFLTLNGHTIKTALGGSRRQDRIGDVGRAFSGQAQSDVRANKDRWRFATVPSTEMEAEYIRGIMLRKGHGWPFDADEYSKSGLGPDGNQQYTIRSNTAADGAVVDKEAKYGAAVSVDEAAVNKLAATVRDAESAPSGFGALVGASLASDTTNFWQGTRSVEVTCSATDDGVQTTAFPPSALLNDVLYATAYVMTDSDGEQVGIRIYDLANFTYGTESTFTLTTAGVWYRIQATHTITANSSDVRIDIRSKTGAQVFSADGFQLELDKVTSWVDGTRASADQLIFDRVTWLQSQNISVSFWTNGPIEGTTRTLWQFGADASNFIQIYATGSGGTNTLVLRTTNAGANTDITKSAAWDGDFHHVAIVIRYNPETGEYNRQLWFDGASVGTDNTGTLPDNSTFTEMSIGCNILAAAQANCIIDDMIVTPFPIFDDTVDAWYNYGESLAAIWPDVYVDGDCVDGRKRCMGVDDDETYFAYGDGTNGRTNGRILQYELWER